MRKKRNISAFFFIDAAFIMMWLWSSWTGNVTQEIPHFANNSPTSDSFQTDIAWTTFQIWFNDTPKVLSNIKRERTFYPKSNSISIEWLTLNQSNHLQVGFFCTIFFLLIFLIFLSDHLFYYIIEYGFLKFNHSWNITNESIIDFRNGTRKFVLHVILDFLLTRVFFIIIIKRNLFMQR